MMSLSSDSGTLNLSDQSTTEPAEMSHTTTSNIPATSAVLDTEGANSSGGLTMEAVSQLQEQDNELGGHPSSSALINVRKHDNGVTGSPQHISHRANTVPANTQKPSIIRKSQSVNNTVGLQNGRQQSNNIHSRSMSFNPPPSVNNDRRTSTPVLMPGKHHETLSQNSCDPLAPEPANSVSQPSPVVPCDTKHPVSGKSDSSEGECVFHNNIIAIIVANVCICIYITRRI